MYLGTLNLEVNDKCISCGACIKGCLKEAIDFGKSTKGKRRYTHPKYKYI